jgi:3-oxoadipate enol-lactonase
VSTVHVNGIDLYYEEHGEGEPLLLIMGWGGNAATWKPQIPGLAQRFRVIAFDNRGVGRSMAPRDPYSIPQMAEDAVGLLDALDVPRAHVFGVSMGGMIAQELAVRHSERLDALVLGCTTPGGRRAAGFRDLQRNIKEFEETNGDEVPDMAWFSDFLKRLWTDRALAMSDTHLQDFVLSLIRFPATPQGLHNQAEAIAGHNAYDRLPRIEHPTLVITGDKDKLIDFENSFILAGRIPSAELRIFPGLKHAFHLEQPELVNSVIIDFIERVRGAKADGAAAARTPAGSA